MQKVVEIPGVTGKFVLRVQNEAGQRLTEFCQENALIIANSSNTRDNSTHEHHQLVNTEIRLTILFCSQRQRRSIQSAKTRPGADCSSDHEVLNAKFRLKLKKVGKTTRPFRYKLNEIPYDYTVEVTDLRDICQTESLKNYGWRFMTLYRRQ